MSKSLTSSDIYQNIRQLIEQSRRKVVTVVNFAMIETYWHIGSIIVEEEQQGKERAAYGDQLIPKLAVQLAKEFGKGFNRASLWRMRQFYHTFPILAAVRRELTWTHYRLLMQVANEQARTFYLEEAVENQWSTRQLDRQINTFYYERLLASQNKAFIREEGNQNAQLMRPEDILKDPTVLEFLGLSEKADYLEKELESAILDKLHDFLLELGKGFSFVGRQKRITTESGKHFYIDLVFYNFILKCFVLIDLKVGELEHADIGQMDMYVRFYEDKWRKADDNPTIGIILCSKKDQTVVKYSLLEDSQQIFASKYQFYLPTEAELQAELKKEIEEYQMMKGLESGEQE